jgi:hypothetical protein
MEVFHLGAVCERCKTGFRQQPCNALDREPRCRAGETQNGNRRTARARSDGEDRVLTHESNCIILAKCFELVDLADIDAAASLTPKPIEKCKCDFGPPLFMTLSGECTDG